MAVEGSSPHTRGARWAHPGRSRLRRIIPAYAGSTTGRTGWRPLVRDHPRIRGEHPTDIDGRSQRSGSSPHTRGALSCLSGRGLTSLDHPRIRGEHAAGWFLAGRSAGSSPHTRGAPLERTPARRRRRIIPAYAGSTASAPGRAAWRSDHPRIRGEHRLGDYDMTDDHGSSPHTRGARCSHTRGSG